MGINRYENVEVSTLTSGVDSIGQYTSVPVPWFATRARVADVNNSLKIADKYRVYTDLVNFTFNYTPNMKMIVDDQDLYSITWRGQEWRITDVRESNDRMNITLLCYYSAPGSPA